MFGATLLMALATGAEARAAEPEASPGAGRRSGFLSDIRLGAGAATLTYDESDLPVADFEAFTLAGALRLGGFIGPHIAIGAELAVTWGIGVGTLRIHDPSYFSGEAYPTSATYGSFSPLGVFVEVYPLRNEGLFLGASAGVGLMDLPDFGHGEGGLMTRWALELGYELGRASAPRAAAYLRFEHWAGSELGISTDYPDGLVSDGLLAGVRWSL